MTLGRALIPYHTAGWEEQANALPNAPLLHRSVVSPRVVAVANQCDMPDILFQWYRGGFPLIWSHDFACNSLQPCDLPRLVFVSCCKRHELMVPEVFFEVVRTPYVNQIHYTPLQNVLSLHCCYKKSSTPKNPYQPTCCIYEKVHKQHSMRKASPKEKEFPSE